jgi:Icc-related predicted phosphoesterase
MRLLLVSDLHYTLRQLDWLIEAARDVDVVVLAGDHLDVASSVPLDAQVVVIGRYLELLAAQTTIVASSGNHDLTHRDADGEKAAPWLLEARRHGVLVDGDSAEVGGALITVCPWWDGPSQRAALTRQIERDQARSVRPWIWVYHWPPANSATTWTGRTFYGDGDLSAWIAEHEPDIVLCGHVHQPPFHPDGGWADRIGSTWVFNAGQQPGPEPSHIVVDLDRASASWTSLLGVEEQPLSDASARPRVLFS